MGRFKFSENVCWKCRDCVVHVDGSTCSECGSPVPKPYPLATTIVLLASVLFFVLLPAIALFAAPTKTQRAAAMVAVAIAQIEAADEHAEIPDQPPRIVRSEPQFEFVPQSVSISSTVPCTVYVATWCVPCHRQQDENGDGDERVSFRYVVQDSPSGTFPCTTYVDSTGKLRSISGYHTTQQIWEIIQRNNPPGLQESYAALGPAGSIHASSQIRSTLNWWRTNIGEGNKVESGWDRTGAQTFPLLAKGDWSYQAVFGNFGRFRFSAPGSNLTMKTGEFVYTVEDGWPVIQKIGPIYLRPILESFTSEQGYSADPSGIGPATILSILSVLRDLHSLLHPTCDLQLGGNVTATAVLTGDTLAIDFQQCPSVKLVALFTFQLSVQRVEIREESVRVVFGGSRLVKERTFKVE